MAYCRSVTTPSLNRTKVVDFKNMTVRTWYKINFRIPHTLKRIAMEIAKTETLETANDPHIVKMTFCSFSGVTRLRISRHNDVLTLHIIRYIYWETERDWDKFIQRNMTLYRCMISDILDSSYVLFSTNLISNTSLHVRRPLLRPFLVAYAEATLARQKKDSAINEKCWHHFRILIADKWSVVWNECKNCEFLLTGWNSLWSNTVSY